MKSGISQCLSFVNSSVRSGIIYFHLLFSLGTPPLLIGGVPNIWSNTTSSNIFCAFKTNLLGVTVV